MVIEKKDKESFIKRKKEMDENSFKFDGVGKVLEEKKKLNLVDIHEAYKKLLYIEDTKRIDIVLAVALSSRLEGIPIWLILVGASGDMKSVQLNAVDGFNTYYLHKITSKTLVNGFKDKEKYPDLAPQLDGHIVVIRDMASLLKLHPVEKGEVWGQLRDLYDGFAGASSGMGVDTKYQGLKITLLAGSTPAIDGQILVHQDLGTRELIYRTKGNINKSKLMDKCFDNEEFEKEITEKLNELTLHFLNHRNVERDCITEEQFKEIKKIAIYVSYMRASADVDSYEKMLRTDVCPEEPTRIAKQMKRIFVCLKGLADDYPDERAFEILWHTAKSSAFQIRVKLLDFMIKQTSEMTTSRIAEQVKLGKGTVQKELSILWNMGLVTLRKEETNYPDKFYDYWKINKSHSFIKGLL